MIAIQQPSCLPHMTTKIISTLLLASFIALNATEPDKPIVGAIRWDAWYGDKSMTAAVEASLGQPKYHYRLPWFARIESGDKVVINGNSEAIMEKEIAYAAHAGLSYWAFLDYLAEAPGMSIGLKRYLAAKDKKGVRYCLVEEGDRLDKTGTQAWSGLIGHFRHPDYQTVLDGRPLLYVFNKTQKLGKSEWDELKRQTIAAGLKAPYLVLMGWESEKDREALDFDAVSEYACSGKGYTPDPETYEKLTSYHVAEALWGKWQRERTPCVTFATAGWDTRPPARETAVLVLLDQGGNTRPHARRATKASARCHHRHAGSNRRTHPCSHRVDASASRPQPCQRHHHLRLERTRRRRMVATHARHRWQA